MKVYLFIVQIDELIIFSNGTTHWKNVAGYSEFTISAYSEKEAFSKLYKAAYKRFNINKNHTILITKVSF